MLKRLELHNHTTESDASITVSELLEFMLEDHVDAFALTDHNTTSGHHKIKKLLAENNYPIECILGMEYTTYYGHILCLNLETYVPWENINLHKPELLFRAAKEAGALAGIAHPFSYGAPFARGCRFDMTVTDYSAVDFIEVFNCPEPLHEVNEPGLKLYEDLVLQGEDLAMTTGMDLHGRWKMTGHYATYVDCEPGEPISTALDRAIKTQKTFITKGPVFEASILNPSDSESGPTSGIITDSPSNVAIATKQKETNLRCHLHPVIKPGFTHDPESVWMIECLTLDGSTWFEAPTLSTEDFIISCSAIRGLAKEPSAAPGSNRVIVKLYEGKSGEGQAAIERLIAISPTVKF